MLKLNIVIDLKRMMDLARFSKENRPVLLRVAADRYLQFLKRRHAAGANWVPLAEETLKRKARRKVATNPAWILRETDTLIDNLEIKKTKDGYDVGHVVDRIHPSTPDRKKRIRISRLVRIHTNGEGNVPPRPVIEPPSDAVLRNMVKDIREEYRRVIRRMRGWK